MAVAVMQAEAIKREQQSAQPPLGSSQEMIRRMTGISGLSQD